MGLASAYLSISEVLSPSLDEEEVVVGFCSRMVESILTSGEIVAVLLGGGMSKEVTLSPIGRRLAALRSTIVCCVLLFYYAVVV